MRLLILSFVIVVAGSVPASGAPSVVKTVRPMEQPFGCVRLTVADGLPNSTTRAILQDKRGFVWLGTDDGLVRYDGMKPYTYRSNAKNPAVSVSGVITALALDDSGKIWIGTAENGVYLYDPDTDRFTRFVRGPNKGSLSSDGVAAIARDAKGRMWFAMSGGGLNRFEPSTGTFTEYATPPLDIGITAIAADPTGNLWLGTTGAVVRWNPNDGTTATHRPEDLDELPIPAILFASNGKVWVGTDGFGVFVLDPATPGTVTQHHHDPANPETISDEHVNVLFEDKQHTMWIGTRKGLNHIDASGKWRTYQHVVGDPASLTSPWVLSLYEDRGGVMWVGASNGGVCSFTRAVLKFGRHYTPGIVASFFEDPDGVLWVGSQNNGLYKYDRKARRVTIYTQLATDTRSVALDKDWIWGLRRDRRGVLWMALQGQGLVAFDTTNETYKHYLPDPDDPNSIPVDTPNDLWEDDKGILWISTWGGGLVKFDPQRGAFTTFGADTHGITSNHLYKLYPDPKDKNILWIGTAKGGLIRFDIAAETGTSFRKTPDNPATLSNDDVLSVYREPSGVIWAGTFGGGLNRIDLTSRKVESFTTGNSDLTNDTILGVLPDDDGKLWLSTSGGGLLLFDPTTKKALIYDTSDGLQDNEFTQSSFMRSKSGELFFGGPSGFNAFFPRDIIRDSYVPPMALTSFEVLNRNVRLDRPIWTQPPLELSYSDSFELQFAALSFAAPKKNRYSYRLEGFEDNYTATDRPFAHYAKLDGGDYVLRVRAANKHGVWNDTGIALKIRVNPPLWKTWPAYTLYAFTVIGIAFLVIRLQRQKLRRVQRESRLAIVEHDLELTGAVQTGFLPEQSEVRTSQVDMVGFYRPAEECSGDWWWHENLDGRHVILVGDVTGHGPGPAMVTAAVAGAFRVLVAAGLHDMRKVLDMLNDEVLRVAKGKYHMTMSVLELEESTGRWQLYNAGAPPVLSLNQAGKHHVHFCPGSPLGTDGFEVGHVDGVLTPHERLLLYTDGIPEILRPDGRLLGMRWFAKLYERTYTQDVKEAAATIVMQADESQADQAQADDWTFAIIEWRGG